MENPYSYSLLSADERRLNQELNEAIKNNIPLTEEQKAARIRELHRKNLEHAYFVGCIKTEDTWMWVVGVVIVIMVIFSGALAG